MVTGTERVKFPANFVWGTAASAYQIEGSADVDGRGESIWDTFCAVPGKVHAGHSGKVACDHYNRYREDVALMASLGMQAYRFSVAWPRVVPDGAGVVNPRGLDFYDRLVDSLLEAGIEPWVCLHHWELPQALEDRGGWPERDTAEHFGRFAEVVASRLGDRVRHWITHNEPLVIAWLGYGTGEHAPGRTSFHDYLQAAHNLLVSHGLATQRVRASAPDSAIGIALNLSQTYPATTAPADVAAAYRHDGFVNRWYLDPLHGRGYPADMLELYAGHPIEQADGDMDLIAQPLDFLGLNYYTVSFVRDIPAGQLRIEQVRREGDRTSMGWLVYPSGLADLTRRVVADYAPPLIYITENGASFPDELAADGSVPDHQRIDFFRRHLRVVGDVVAEGLPVAGYFAWSLLDNFEWALGYDRRFGLVHVDFDTLKRTIKDSGHWLREVIAMGGWSE